MRRPMVIALAFLTVSLTGGSCEFRAVSNNSVPRDPPLEGEPDEQQTGLLIGVNVGDSDPLTGVPTIQSSTIETALTASVLSVPSQTPNDSADSSPWADLSESASRPERALAVSAVEAPSSRISKPIPEPAGIWLFGLGSGFLAWRFRRPRSSS